jgi:hypothetical protein
MHDFVVVDGQVPNQVFVLQHSSHHDLLFFLELIREEKGVLGYHSPGTVVEFVPEDGGEYVSPLLADSSARIAGFDGQEMANAGKDDWRQNHG